MTATSTKKQTIDELDQQIKSLENCPKPLENRFLPTGIAELDQLLPGSGLRCGTLVEWYETDKGSGALTMALQIARSVCGTEGTLIMIDPDQELYPLAMSLLGIDLARTIFIHPETPLQTLWALEQSLRCPGATVTICRLSDLNSQTFRRLQLAAEKGGTLAMILRSDKFKKSPSWSETRLCITPVPSHCNYFKKSDFLTGLSSHTQRRIQIKLLRTLQGLHSSILELDINDETGAVHVVSKLADTTSLSGLPTTEPPNTHRITGLSGNTSC